MNRSILVFRFLLTNAIQGYRARSSFKIVQINQKFGHFLEKSKVVIDLCAAPGSWCQVASACCPLNSLIIGVDLAPIKPLPNVITFQSDITTEHCRSQLRSYMKTWKADTVMHDGAPNVGMAWAQDAFTQSELVLQSLKLAVEFLAQGGTFVTKVFRSKDYNNLMWVFQQFFEKVEATKPPASRNVSAEIFVVCRGFKAPKKIDPRLLDPKAVFEEIQEGTQDNQAKVFNPEKKKRKRDGYEEGDYTQYHTIPAMEFITLDDPIQALGTLNAIILDHKAVPELRPVSKMASTTPELLECFKDLKVLGRKEFKQILKWRKAARELLGLEEDKEAKKASLADAANQEPVDEETQIDRELAALKDKEDTRKKRLKRRENERKQKEVMRMQMNMDTPMDIGLEAGAQDQSLFNLKSAERSGELESLSKGKRAMLPRDEDHANEHMDIGDEYDERDEEEIVDDLEEELDDMYGQYKQRRAESDARARAKRARDESEDEEWYGIKDTKSDSDSDSDSDDSMIDANEEQAKASDSDDDESINKLIASLRPEKASNGLSRKAALFFSNPLFKEAAFAAGNGAATSGKVEVAAEAEDENGVVVSSTNETSAFDSEDEYEGAESSDDDEGIEMVPAEDEDDWQENVPKTAAVPEIISAQAMTLAHELALGTRNKASVIDEGYNRYAFRDREGLPDWFLEDEETHSRISKPITKEAVEAIKAKFKAMNSRPIKKVAEAQARKKMRAVKKLEKLKKKTDLINDDEARSEREKADEIQRLTRKLTAKKKKEKPTVTLVPARGQNKRLQGRPRGVKGKYKMVDGTMKKEQRALNRIQKKRK